MIKKLFVCMMTCLSLISLSACGSGSENIKVTTADDFAAIARREGFEVDVFKPSEAFRGVHEASERAEAEKPGMEASFYVFTGDSDARELFESFGGVTDDANKKNGQYVIEGHSDFYCGDIRIVRDGPIVVFYDLFDDCPNRNIQKKDLEKLSKKTGY